MITIHRNNSRLLQFTFKKPDGTAWNVPSGNILKFSVKKSVVDNTTVIEKTFNGNGGNNYSIFLSGSDTNINCGTYKYDIKDTTANLTYCNPTNFVISEVVNVGESVVGSQNEDDSVEVTVDVGLLNTDYAPLTNKPKINSIELSGNKTSADLGLQGELTAGENITITNNVISASGGGTSDYSDLTNKPSINNVTLSGNKTTSDLGITIPTKTSDLTNDSGFLTSHQDISGKADTSWVNTQLATKQDTLTAGTGIDITDNVISVNLTNYENEEF